MKILILGVGNAQVDAIEYLKSQNIDVHGISYRKEGVGLRLVDTFDLVNIADKEAVLAYAKEKNFDVIYSVGSDVAMPTASYVSEVLGKPHFVTESIADLLQDKVLFREFQVKHNIKPLPAQKIKTIKDAENWNNYPAIIKPVDSQGQRGVYEVFSHEDISNNLEQSLSFSRKKEVILEKYVDGPELSVNCFFNDSEMLYCFISTREVVENLPGGIVKGHATPANISALLKEEIFDIVKLLTKKIGICNGPFYLQMKYNASGVYVIEAAPRLDGCHMFKLIEKSTGINLLALSFDLLINGFIEKDVIPDRNESFKLDFFLLAANSHFSKAKIAINALSEDVIFYYKEGELVRPVNGHIEKTGYQIYKI